MKFFSIHFRSAMTYRASFFLSCLGHLLITTNVFLSVVFLLDRFTSVGGYTLPQLALCFAVILSATSLAECFGRGFDAFAKILSQAQFDRMMVRPRSLAFQVLCQDMKPTMLARLLQAVILLVWAVNGPREYGKYPFGIYGRPVLLTLTFLVPLALVQHWPLQYLLGRGPAWYGVLPVVSLLFLIPCVLLWRLGVRHYRSTGS